MLQFLKWDRNKYMKHSKLFKRQICIKSMSKSRIILTCLSSSFMSLKYDIQSLFYFWDLCQTISETILHFSAYDEEKIIFTRSQYTSPTFGFSCAIFSSLWTGCDKTWTNHITTDDSQLSSQFLSFACLSLRKPHVVKTTGNF